MNKSKRNTLIASSVAFAVAALAQAAVADEHGAKEKCYGGVKAGKNDCGNISGTHGCMGHAAVDGDPGEWVLVPAGLCEKLVGGSLVGKEGEANACNGEHGCEHA